MSWKKSFFHLFCPFCSFRTFFRDCAGRAKRKRSLHAPLTHVRTHTRTHLLSFHSLSLSSFIPYRSFSLNLKVRKKEFERASYGSLSLSLTDTHASYFISLSLRRPLTQARTHTHQLLLLPLLLLLLLPIFLLIRCYDCLQKVLQFMKRSQPEWRWRDPATPTQRNNQQRPPFILLKEWKSVFKSKKIQ